MSRYRLPICRLLLSAMLLFAVPLYAAEPDLAQMRKQAGQGDAWAQLNLGAAYDNGLGVEQNVERARHWYQKAAEQGVAEAQFNLAHLLVTEEEQSTLAAEWMLKAAKQGMADAQYLMGVTYAEGIGVEENEDKAIVWLKKAVAQGHEDAATFLRESYHIR